MKKKLILIITLLIIICSAGIAQKAKLKRANKKFEQLNYNEAIQLYLEILDKKDILGAKIKLAESYWKVSNTVEAEYWYGQLVELPEIKPIYYLRYAQALNANRKCLLAKVWFEKYLEVTGEMGNGLLSCDETEVNGLIFRRSFYEIKSLEYATFYFLGY